MDIEVTVESVARYFGEKTAYMSKETTDDEIRCIYDERSGEYEQEQLAARVAHHKPLIKCFHKAFEQVFHDKPKDQIKIVDAAAGTGWLGVELKKLEYTNLYALDISPEMLKLAKKKKIYKDLICAALNGQPIPQIETGQFDALICGGSILEGRIGPSAFVEMIRMVRAGGFLCFNIRASDVGKYVDQMKELEKAGKWIFLFKENLPFYEAEGLPKQSIGFAYKVLEN